MATNDIKFIVKNGLAVGASGFEVINTQGEWVGASGAGQSPYGATGVQGVTGASGVTGEIGTDGASGVTGVTGDQGVVGTDGVQGATGILGSTGAFGEDGYQGIDGADGYQGATGSIGTQGASGADGVQGIDGASGITGASGASGIDGASGVTGETGATGVSGARYHTTSTTNLDFGTYFTTDILVVDEHLSYSAGQTIIINDLAHAGQHFHATVNSYDPVYKALNFTVVDFVGIISSQSWEINLDGAVGGIGASGATGYDGATGILGEDGYQGASGADGYQGASGSTGYQGASGADGYQGSTGILGSTGAFGASGTQGIDGADGYQGATGSIGTQGIDGEQGYQGINGDIGITGSTGLQGGDGSGTPFNVTFTHGVDFNNLVAWTDASMTGDGLHHFEYHAADTYLATTVNALQIGDTITIEWPSATQGSVPPTILTVIGLPDYTSTYTEFSIKVSVGPLYTYGQPFYFTYNGTDTVKITSTYGPTNTGYQGASGADGEQGPNGNAGFNADQLTYGNPRGVWDIATTYYPDDIVVTVPADSHRCLVENTGFNPDSYPEYWAYTAWAGASGVSGIDGASGPTGSNGEQGLLGTNAATGPTGSDGEQGLLGTNAATGPTGQDGATGINGASGIDGASGPTGQTGTDGATGSNGLQFKATANGYFSISAVGTSQYDVYFQVDPDTENTFYNYSVGQSVIMAYDINNYMVGNITATDGYYIDFLVTKSVGTADNVNGWIVNLDGAIGVIGATGSTGQDGATGVTGELGATGAPGASGITGASGVTGEIGTDGASGVTGVVGASGTTGEDGATGIYGASGTDGASGVTGASGSIGIDGATGFSLSQGSTGLTSTGSNQTIDIFAANMVGTAKYLVQGVQGSNVQATEVILTQNASGVWMTEYATLRTNTKVMDVSASTNGSVVSLLVTPTNSNTDFAWVREDVKGRIGGTTIEDDGSNVFSSYSHADIGSIPVGKAYVYPTQYFYDQIDFYALASAHSSVTFDAAGVGPINPAIGTVDSWDGGTLIVTITSGNFTSRNDLDKITYDY